MNLNTEYQNTDTPDRPIMSGCIVDSADHAAAFALRYAMTTSNGPADREPYQLVSGLEVAVRSAFIRCNAMYANVRVSMITAVVEAWGVANPAASFVEHKIPGRNYLSNLQEEKSACEVACMAAESQRQKQREKRALWFAACANATTFGQFAELVKEANETAYNDEPLAHRMLETLVHRMTKVADKVYDRDTKLINDCEHILHMARNASVKSTIHRHDALVAFDTIAQHTADLSKALRDKTL